MAVAMTILERVSGGHVFEEGPRQRNAQIFKIKNIYFELLVVVMRGGRVVGDVVVCCLCVFGIIMLVLLDVFVVLQEKKEKNKCNGV